MAYICLFCANPDGNPGTCGPCRQRRVEIKEWGDYAGRDLITLANFNPSCRRIAFDIHVDPTTNSVYVVVKVNVTYEDGTAAPAWDAGRRARFARLLKASVGLWDGRVTLIRYVRGGMTAQYTPRFFIDIRTGLFAGVHMSVTAVSSNPPQRFDRSNNIGSLGELMLAPGLVVLRGPYPDTRPRPSSGVRHSVNVRINEYAPRSYEGDNLRLPRTSRLLVNTMAHEYGHMIGIPDEYDAYPGAFSTANLGGGRVNRGMLNSDKDKTVAFWVELLGANGMVSPAWGHLVAEDSIMRNVDTRAVAFRNRHYVTILEGLNLISQRSLGGLIGAWTI